MATTQASIDPDAFNAFEAAGWERRADGYNDFFGSITTQVIGRLLDAAEVERGMRVLDAASGPGYVAAACAARGADVVGADVAAEMVSLARTLHPELEFAHADVERLPFADGSFDAVLASFLILHVGRPEQVAAALARVLRPGGKLALSTWDFPERARLLGVLVDAVAEVGAQPTADIPAGPPIFRFADEGEFARLLASAGLGDVDVQTVAFTHRSASSDELWNGLIGGTVRTRALVLAQAEHVQAQIRAAFDRLVRPYATNSALEIPVSVKLASGRRPLSPAITAAEFDAVAEEFGLLMRRHEGPHEHIESFLTGTFRRSPPLSRPPENIEWFRRQAQRFSAIAHCPGPFSPRRCPRANLAPAIFKSFATTAVAATSWPLQRGWS